MQATQTPYKRENVRDRIDNFNGQQLLYIGWDDHQMICAPIALALSPDTTVAELIDTILPNSAFALHPDWNSVNWSEVQWYRSDSPVDLQRNKTLAELGLGHKAYIHMKTPGLTGIGGTGS